MTSTAVASTREILERCERFLLPFPPSWRRPREMLQRLADRVPADADLDRYGEGELIESFEARLAELLGKEKALFLPSSTMGQQIVLRIHCDRRGRRTVAVHPTGHIEIDEEDAYRRVQGLDRVFPCGAEELLRAEHLHALSERVGALVIELPQRALGGVLPEWADLVEQVEWAHENGAAVHLDGARLWEAAPWYGRDLAEICALFDTVNVSFYKGLGGIAGGAVAGPADVVDEAVVWQKRLGGRLLSLYPYVLSAEIGLERNLPQMPRFYEYAVELGAALSAVPGIDVVPDPPQCPLMYLLLRGDSDALVAAALEIASAERIWLFGGLSRTRNPKVQQLELVVGEAMLEIEPDEAAALLARVVERARSASVGAA